MFSAFPSYTDLILAQPFNLVRMQIQIQVQYFMHIMIWNRLYYSLVQHCASMRNNKNCSLLLAWPSEYFLVFTYLLVVSFSILNWWTWSFLFMATWHLFVKFHIKIQTKPLLHSSNRVATLKKVSITKAWCSSTFHCCVATIIALCAVQ